MEEGDWDEEDEFEDDYPEYKSVNLAWDDYTKFEDITPDGNSTLLIPLGGYEYVEKEISKLKEILEKKEFETKTITNKEGYGALKISLKNKEIATLFSLANCLAARISNSKEGKQIKKMLEEFTDNPIGEICHREEAFPISKSNLNVIVRTGIVKNDEFWEPYSFWKFFLKDEHIGKAIIRFHAPEIDDCAPTVKLFEVFEDFRRNGFGGQMIYGIEKYMCEHDFNKLRLDNTQATPFWRENGYEIDIDEGEKELECWEYEN